MPQVRVEASVARYYMQLRDGTDELLDPEGIVLLSVRDLISGDVVSGEADMRFRVDAEDRDGVFTRSPSRKR